MVNRFLSLFRNGSALTDPYEQFVAAMLEECRRQGLEPSGHDPQARSLEFRDVNGESVTAFLENLFRMWLASNEGARADRIERFVRSIVPPGRIDPETLTGELMPGMRRRAMVGRVRIEHEIMGRDNELAATPWCGELAVCICRDLPARIALLSRSELDDAGLSFDEAMATAMAQLRTRTPAPDFEPVGDAPGVFYCGNLEDYQSSLLLLTPGEDFTFPMLAGDPVAVVPARNQFFVAGSADRRALRALLECAETAREQPHFCSSALWLWRGGGWREYTFEAGTDEAVRQRHIARRSLASDYAAQREDLDRLHEKQDKDIFAASFMVYGKPGDPGSEFSVAIVVSGTSGWLLPVADRIIFSVQATDPGLGMTAEETDRVVQVAWPDAMAIAGHLFEPMTGLYPPRYRALGFPDAAMRNTLVVAGLTRSGPA